MHRRQRRRRLSVSSLNASFNADPESTDLGENDDTLERNQARRHGPRQKSTVPLITPARSTRANRSSARSNRANRSVRSNRSSRSRRSSPSPFTHKTYTNEQLSQIYKDCIIKAQQGKITQQNAWNLHLVDNIEEITDLNTGAAHDSNSNTNSDRRLASNAFAHASHTIDAASKIYGYRVDSVHNKTYRVLDSIHQQAIDGNVDGNEADELVQRKRKRKERNRNVGKSTLCDADKLYKLDESMKNLCVEVDALFHKTASCFDEGGAKGLLMNTLYVQNGCDIVFDSSTKIEQNEDITNAGVQIDHQQIENEEEIEKEHGWMTQLAESTWNKFSQFSQALDIDSADVDISTQNNPHNFKVDLKWIEKTSICPLLNVFDNGIKAIKANLPMDLSANNNHTSPEKDLNNSNGSGMMYDEHGDDDDIMMDMPDFTIGGGDDGLNAQDLFHEELLTQAMAPEHPHSNQLQSFMDLNSSNNRSNILQIPANPQYVVGQHGAAIIGNMGVQPYQLLNQSMSDNREILNNIQLEQENVTGQYGALHRGGIYKRGAMNISAMNEVISKLENADFENLTSFFDAKKHANWAGPDQWCRRRFLLTTKNKASKSKAGAAAVHGQNNQSNPNATTLSPTQRRRQKKCTKFDFCSVANGNLIDEKEFEEPARSDNTLTQAVLNKNRKTFHTLPKDLQIKPDMFIKLFHRPNYSVWKHWLRQHQIRMIKKREEMMAGHNNMLDVGDVRGNMDQSMFDGGMDAGFGDDAVPQFLAQQAAAMAVNHDDDEDEFKYDYNNPMDSQHFVPDMNGSQDNGDGGLMNFNLHGYDLIDIDQSRKVEKIKVEFASTAKKINIRKLKLKLWDKIHTDLPDEAAGINKENVENNNHNNNNNNNEDVDMNEVNDVSSFQNALDSLPCNISSSISVQMCFICLLHLANEKKLQFVPKMVSDENTNLKLERGNFDIQYANSQSLFEKDAQQINPIMVLGMR